MRSHLHQQDSACMPTPASSHTSRNPLRCDFNNSVLPPAGRQESFLLRYPRFLRAPFSASSRLQRLSTRGHASLLLQTTADINLHLPSTHTPTNTSTPMPHESPLTLTTSSFGCSPPATQPDDIASNIGPGRDVCAADSSSVSTLNHSPPSHPNHPRCSATMELKQHTLSSQVVAALSGLDTVALIHPRTLGTYPAECSLGWVKSKLTHQRLRAHQPHPRCPTRHRHLQPPSTPFPAAQLVEAHEVRHQTLQFWTA
jgi:hypothetical protein